MIRRQINVFRFFLGDDVPIPIIPMRGYMWRELLKGEPSFHYKGDEIMWCHEKNQWLSLSFGALFPTLQSMDDMWEEYERACEAEANAHYGDPIGS